MPIRVPVISLRQPPVGSVTMMWGATRDDTVSLTRNQAAQHDASDMPCYAGWRVLLPTYRRWYTLAKSLQ